MACRPHVRGADPMVPPAPCASAEGAEAPAAGGVAAARIASTICSADCFATGLPHFGQCATAIDP